MRFLTWVFRSPTHLAATLAAVALLVGAVVLSVQAGDADPERAEVGAVRASTPPSARPAATEGLPDVAAPVEAAVSFVDAWGDTSTGPASWLDSLRPLATADLLDGLAYTAHDAVPAVFAAGAPRVRMLADSSALVAVPVSDGGSVLVTVVLRDGGWLAADIQPDAGDWGAS